MTGMQESRDSNVGIMIAMQEACDSHATIMCLVASQIPNTTIDCA